MQWRGQRSKPSTYRGIGRGGLARGLGHGHTLGHAGLHLLGHAGLHLLSIESVAGHPLVRLRLRLRLCHGLRLLACLVALPLHDLLLLHVALEQLPVPGGHALQHHLLPGLRRGTELDE